MSDLKGVDLLPYLLGSQNMMRIMLILGASDFSKHFEVKDGKTWISNKNFFSCFKHPSVNEFLKVLCFAGVTRQHEGDILEVDDRVVTFLAYETDPQKGCLSFFDTMLTRQNYHLADVLIHNNIEGLLGIYGDGKNFYHANAKFWNEKMNRHSAEFIPRLIEIMKNIPDDGKWLDLACNHGENVCLYYSRKFPGATFTLVDLPEKKPEIVEYVASQGLAERAICDCSYNIFDPSMAPADKYDVITITHFLPMFPSEEVEQLFAFAFNALRKGGQLFMIHKAYYGEPSADNSEGRPALLSFSYFWGSAMGKGSFMSAEWHTSALKRAGFSQVSDHTIDCDWSPGTIYEKWCTFEIAFHAIK